MDKPVESTADEWHAPPNYPDCKHPNVDMTRKTCVYCGQLLTEDDVKQRAYSSGDAVK